MTVTIVLPTKVEFILNALNSSGFDAYVVGGCVRDSLMGRIPHDWDICSDAIPQEVKMIFDHVVPTGEKHGTVTVILDGEEFEITTFRTDGDYSDGRHPDSVSFTRNIEDDLKRRDFTINAMAFNPTSGLVDLFGGVDDIEGGIIRCVGDANDRFSEDALRMMRAIRFSAQLDFNIDPMTFCSIIGNSWKIENVSFERIRDEIVKTITSDFPQNFRLFHETRLLHHISADLDRIFDCTQRNPHHIFDVSGHTMLAMEKIKNTPVFRLAMLFHDIGKPLTKTIGDDGIDHFFGHETVSAEITEYTLTALKFDNDTIAAVVNLVRFHMAEIGTTKPSVKRWMNRIGSFDEFIAVLNVKVADAYAQNMDDFNESFRIAWECARLANEINDAKEVFSKANLAINGNDLIEIGVHPSRRMGEMIDALVEIVIDNPEMNTKENLISIAKRMSW